MSTRHIACIGGISGMSQFGALENCHSSCAVTSLKGSAGGIAGVADSALVNFCYSTGPVMGKGKVGGLIGWATFRHTTVQNSFCTGPVSDVSADTGMVGGLIGDNGGTVSNCYATGAVNGVLRAGGLAGNNSGSLSNCYATGPVTATQIAGGFAGNNTGSLINCYSAGKVTCATQGGGFVGITNNPAGTVLASFWNKETSQKTSGIGLTAGSGVVALTGLTTAQMKQTTNFSGFDFTNLYSIRADSTYPGLRSIDDAPFAFADSLISPTRSYSLAHLLANDCDMETMRNRLILRVLRISSGATDSTTSLTFGTAPNGTVDTVTYRIGEIRLTPGDTLWGNLSIAYIRLDTTFISPVSQPGTANSARSFSFKARASANGVTLCYDLPKTAHVSITMYNVAGKLVASVVDGRKSAGSHVVALKLPPLAAGVYLCRFSAGQYHTVRELRMAL